MEIFEFISYFFELLSDPHIAVSDTSGIFDSFYTVLMRDLMIPLSDKFNDVTEFIRPIFTFAVGLFVSVFGYMILSGKIKAPAEEFVWRISIIALLFWLAFDPARYEKFIIKPVMGTTTAVTKLISPQAEGFFGLFKENVKVGQKNESIYENNRGLFMGLDVAVESVSIILKGTVESFTTLQTIKIEPKKTQDGSKPNEKEDDTAKSIKLGLMSDMLIVGFVGLIITGAVMVYVTAGAILMLNHVFLVLMLMIGPAFIVMAAYKPTREYAKRWLSRVLAIMLTLAICSAVIAFILFIQKDITAQMCQATGSLQHAFYNKAKNAGAKEDDLKNFSSVKNNLNKEFLKLKAKLVLAGASNAIGGGGTQSIAQSTAAVGLVDDIIKGCNLGTNTSTPDTSKDSDMGVNIMFYAIQYLIVCMILNRLLSESANVAGSIVNSSGLTTGASQEVSGGAQGMSGRLGAGGTSPSGAPRGGGG